MKKIDELVDGYFEGTLSEDEETALKLFLASEEGQGPEYDEVRAVMGYFAAGRSVEILRSRPLPQNDRKVWRRILAIAASMAIIITIMRKESIRIPLMPQSRRASPTLRSGTVMNMSTTIITSMNTAIITSMNTSMNTAIITSVMLKMAPPNSLMASMLAFLAEV